MRMFLAKEVLYSSHMGPYFIWASSLVFLDMVRPNAQTNDISECYDPRVCSFMRVLCWGAHLLALQHFWNELCEHP